MKFLFKDYFLSEEDFNRNLEFHINIAYKAIEEIMEHNIEKEDISYQSFSDSYKCYMMEYAQELMRVNGLLFNEHFMNKIDTIH